MKQISFPMVAAAALVLAGCGSVGGGVNIDVPLMSGISLGVGVGTGGAHVGVGGAHGPVGVDVGVNQSGQVTGSVGVDASKEVGGARVGVGVGTGTVVYDPNE